MSEFDIQTEDLENRTPEEREEILRFLDSYEAQERHANPLKFFVPNLTVEKIINAVGDDVENKRLIYLVPAANSIGKTAAGCSILANIIWGPQNRWFDRPRFRQWPKDWPKGFWYMSEKATLRQTVCGIDDKSPSEIRKWFPRGKYNFQKAGYEYYSSLVVPEKGWAGTFMSYDMDPKQFESVKVSIIIMDEPSPEQLFSAALSRITMGGIIIILMTPLYSAAWTKERIIDKDDGSSMVIVGDIEDNCADCHPGRGMLSHKRIQALMAQWDPDELAARAHGEYMYLSNMIYRGLHEATHRHARTAEEFTQDRFRIYCVVDPHDVKPPAVAHFALETETGKIFVVHEFPSEPEFPPYHQIATFKYTTHDVCRRVKEIEQEALWDPHLIVRVMDPNFGKTKKGDMGLTPQEYWKKIGREIEWPLNFRCDVNDDLKIGHSMVQDFIKGIPDPADPTKFIPLLSVGLNCPNMWHQLTHYSRVKESGQKLERHGQGETVSKKYKDFCDLMRYDVMFYKGPRPKPKPKKEDEVPEYYRLLQEQAKRDEERASWRNPHKI